MAGRPFKPPSQRSGFVQTNHDREDLPFAHKKRRLNHELPRLNAVQGIRPPNGTPDHNEAAASRVPLLNVVNPSSAGGDSEAVSTDRYYSVLWRNFTQKKHKNWDGDGVLTVRGGHTRLQDVSGRDLGSSSSASAEVLEVGSCLKIGGKDVEIVELVSREDFLAGRPFSDNGYIPVASSIAKPYQAPTQTKPVDITRRPRPLLPASSGLGKSFKNPLLHKSTVLKADGERPVPRHDPTAEGALVMRRPKRAPLGRQVVDVVVDPFLSEKLRPHQREGVSFLYECVMGMREAGEGAILADEMGLGKTLQTIALLWTLLKQNPTYGAPPIVKKALIVCPVTLIKNWKKEFRKWLGNERIGVFVADGAKVNLRDFTMGKSYSVMIIGYERLRLVQEELQKGSGVDIVIADEGHRLKTAKNKSAQAILSLNTDKRIVLSGTPIQNDLSEFFVMVDFVNPGILPKFNTFKRNYEAPILKSRQPDALKKDIELGQARGEELARLTKVFILRRTAEVLAKYLPSKTETVLFCKPTNTQVQIYDAILGSSMYGSILGSPEASFQLIAALKKVCNTPALLKNRVEKGSDDKVNAILTRIPPNYLQCSPSTSSGKIIVLNQLLSKLRKETDEKVVLVSNYTSTLDILESHLTSNGWRSLRLDGSTATSKRQDLVDTFNRTPAQKYFAFLLSAKAGGVGLNLIGASRLILFDVDWNPTTDLQAMARIHRDGQKREVVIYRLLTAGGIDEKIYQRQLTKQGLADEVMDNKSSASSFTRDELRDLFRLDTTSLCQTHDLLGCLCGGRGTSVAAAADVSKQPDDSDDDDIIEAGQLIKASQVDMAAQEEQIKNRNAKRSAMQTLMKFRHIDPGCLDVDSEENKEAASEMLDDEILLGLLLAEKEKRISYLFSKKST